MGRVSRAVVAMGLCGLFGACGGSGSNVNTCVPGDVKACPCLGGGMGVQECNASGTYGMCSCPGMIDAGDSTIDASEIDAQVVIDASQVDALTHDAAVQPDITGSFYVAYSPVPVAPSATIHFIWEVVLTQNGDGTAMVTVMSTPLNAQTRVKIPPATSITGGAVNVAGEFTVVVDDMVLPGPANPLSGSQVLLDLHSNAVITGEDFFCGVVNPGTVVNPPIDLSTSTFGGQRILPGAEGVDLPAPVVGCPADMPDGGMSADAGEPGADAS